MPAAPCCGRHFPAPSFERVYDRILTKRMRSPSLSNMIDSGLDLHLESVAALVQYDREGRE